MHSPERNFTGNHTISEIILFEVPPNRHSSTGEVGVVGRECSQAKQSLRNSVLKGTKGNLAVTSK